MKNKEILKLTFVSALIAIAFVFSLLTKFVPGLNLEMPQGGSVFGIAMLPLVFVAILFGPYLGVLAGMVYGLTSLMLDGVLYHWASLFIDYLLAFGFIGFAGFFKQALYKPKDFIYAVLLAGMLRYLSHSFGGAIIFAEYAPEGVNPWFYSFIMYNLPYMLSSTAITLVVGLLVLSRVRALALDFRIIDHLK
jgi:thiamine transporter